MLDPRRNSAETEIGRLRLTSPTGLHVEAATHATDPLVDIFYGDYDRAFILPNEKERLDGFRQCLVLNEGDRYASLERLFGGFREYVVVVSDPALNSRVAGANFIAFVLDRGVGDPVLSINLNYIFTCPDFRRRGYFGRLVKDFASIALSLFTATNRVDVPAAWLNQRTPQSGSLKSHVFIEQNDPFLMSRDDYENDTRFTGLDQARRIAIWARLGAKIVDFDYVQPPLSSAQEPDRTLVYAVLGVEGDSLDACKLHDHLQRFFAISVLKGLDPDSDPTAASQLQTLARLCSESLPVKLLPLQDAPHPDPSSSPIYS